MQPLQICDHNNNSVMQISQTTLDLIFELKEFSGDKLKNETDLTYLIEVSHSANKNKMFDDIIFTAKYINGLTKILQSNQTLSPNPQSNGGKLDADEARLRNGQARNKIKGEYKSQMKRLAEQLKEYSESFPPQAEQGMREDFQKRFLAMTQESMANLTTLVYDLSWLKLFYNSKK